MIALVAVAGRLVLAQQAEKPLTKNQVTSLVTAGMDNSQLAKLVRERGIDFEPTDDDIQALRKAGAQDVLIAALRAIKPQALSRDKVLNLVVGRVPMERAAALVRQHGVDFAADEEYLGTLRLAGADDALIAAVREASAAALGELLISTSPGAEIFLDGASQGHANDQGKWALRAKLGAHTLKVSLAGKKDFQQSLTLATTATAQIEAPLADVLGSIRVRTLAGASLTLDGASRGSADPNGNLVVGDLPPGPHELAISAPHKKDYRLTVTVLGGQETRLDAALEDAGPAPEHENPPASAASSADVIFWQSIKDSVNPQDFQDYLTAFPNGAFVLPAKRKIEHFQLFSLGGSIWSFTTGQPREIPSLFIFTRTGTYKYRPVFKNKRVDESATLNPDAQSLSFDAFVAKYFGDPKRAMYITQGSWTTNPSAGTVTLTPTDTYCPGLKTVFTGTVSDAVISGTYHRDSRPGGLFDFSGCNVEVNGNFELKLLAKHPEAVQGK